MLLKAVASLGRWGINSCASFGRAGLMLFHALAGKPQFVKHGRLVIRQIYSVGVLSLLIILVSGLFIGMVLGLQGYLVLKPTAQKRAWVWWLRSLYCVNWGPW